MRKSRFFETQIIKMLKAAETGRPVADICRENGISATTFYTWKTNVRRLKELEVEHSRLKQIFRNHLTRLDGMDGLISLLVTCVG